MATPIRRSRRARKPNPKYDDQIAWDEALPMLRAESDSPDRSSDSPTPEAVERKQDQDVKDMVIQDADEAEPESYRDEADLSDAAESSSVGSPDEDGRGRDVYVSRLASTSLGRHKKTVPRPRTKALAAEQGLRSRMLGERDGPKLRFSKEKVYTYNFGFELDDLYPVMRSRDVWHNNPRDVVLPSRRSMREALRLKKSGSYLWTQLSTEVGSQHVLTTTDQDDQIEFESSPVHQKIRRLDEKDAAQQKFWDLGVFNDVVVGRSFEARRLELEALQPLDVTEASQRPDSVSSYENGIFSVLSPPCNNRSQPDRAPMNAPSSRPEIDGSTESLPTDAYHRGWLINLGARPLCLAWASVNSNAQYLAIALKCSKFQREKAASKPSKLAPAFSPSPKYPSHLQIWRIMASEGDPDAPAKLNHDLSCAPHLLQRMCFKFGDLLRLEWLTPPDEMAVSQYSSMAILSSDGNIRLITVDLAAEGTFEITEPQLIARPPSHTVFTCFTLPSNEDLIAGGADGAVRLYNLHSASAEGELTPYATFQVHHTYLMNIVVATDLPYYLASTSASGEMILTDLRSPDQDRVRLHKSRLPTRNLSYLPHARIFLSTSDASGNSEPHGTSLSTVIGQSLRHFYHSNTIMKLPEASGVATVLASSSFHPIVLAANAAGSIFTTNVLRRLLPTPVKDETGGGFMMKLCEVDWIPLSREGLVEGRKESISARHDLKDEADHLLEGGELTHRFIPDPAEVHAKPKPDIDAFYGAETRSGITRIHEFFKPERIELSTFGQENSERKEKGKNKDQRRAENMLSAASYQIVCHEEQAVTAMAWDSNSRFAGWAALAWGSGVLRIQDLAHGD